MANTHGGAAPDYFVPAPAQWPMVGMIAMAFVGIETARHRIEGRKVRT